MPTADTVKALQNEQIETDIIVRINTDSHTGGTAFLPQQELSREPSLTGNTLEKWP